MFSFILGLLASSCSNPNYNSKISNSLDSLKLRGNVKEVTTKFYIMEYKYGDSIKVLNPYKKEFTMVFNQNKRIIKKYWSDGSYNIFFDNGNIKTSFRKYTPYSYKSSYDIYGNTLDYIFYSDTGTIIFSRTTSKYDSLNNLIEKKEYDKDNKVVYHQKYDYHPGGKRSYITTLDYDEDGNLATIHKGKVLDAIQSVTSKDQIPKSSYYCAQVLPELISKEIGFTSWIASFVHKWKDYGDPGYYEDGVFTKYDKEGNPIEKYYVNCEDYKKNFEIKYKNNKSIDTVWNFDRNEVTLYRAKYNEFNETILEIYYNYFDEILVKDSTIYKKYDDNKNSEIITFTTNKNSIVINTSVKKYNEFLEITEENNFDDNGIAIDSTIIIYNNFGNPIKEIRSKTIRKRHDISIGESIEFPLYYTSPSTSYLNILYTYKHNTNNAWVQRIKYDKNNSILSIIERELDESDNWIKETRYNKNKQIVRITEREFVYF